MGMKKKVYDEAAQMAVSTHMDEVIRELQILKQQIIRLEIQMMADERRKASPHNPLSITEKRKRGGGICEASPFDSLSIAEKLQRGGRE